MCKQLISNPNQEVLFSKKKRSKIEFRSDFNYLKKVQQVENCAMAEWTVGAVSVSGKLNEINSVLFIQIFLITQVPFVMPLDFWSQLPWVSNRGWIPHFGTPFACVHWIPPIHLWFLLMASTAAQLFWSTYFFW